MISERCELFVEGANGTRQLVAVVNIPPFAVPPVVIVWGERYFTFQRVADHRVLHYAECWAYQAPMLGVHSPKMHVEGATKKPA